MRHFIVIGRARFDDEDIIKIGQYKNQNEAEDDFIALVNEYQLEHEDQVEEVIVSYVIECDTKPRIVSPTFE